MNSYDYADILDRITKRREAFDKELDSNSPRSDLLLITNNVEASVKDIYVFLKDDLNARQDSRKDILKELRKADYLNDNLRNDVRLFFEIRDQYAHNMIIDDAHKEAENLLAQITFVKLRSKEDPDWKYKKTREKVIRIYNVLMLRLLNQWNSVVIDNASKQT